MCGCGLPPLTLFFYSRSKQGSQAQGFITFPVCMLLVLSEEKLLLDLLPRLGTIKPSDTGSASLTLCNIIIYSPPLFIIFLMYAPNLWCTATHILSKTQQSPLNWPCTEDSSSHSNSGCVFRYLCTVYMVVLSSWGSISSKQVIFTGRTTTLVKGPGKRPRRRVSPFVVVYPFGTYLREMNLPGPNAECRMCHLLM